MLVLILSSEPASAAPDPESEDLDTLLDQLGCEVRCADLSSAAWGQAGENLPDVIIVDAHDDMGVARRARKALAGDQRLGDVPVLLAVGVRRLAALDFSVGFADFVLKPFVPAEVYARLRQIDWKTAAFGTADRIKVGSLSIDLRGREVFVDGRLIALTPQEFELLRFLAENLGRALERDEILRKVWDYASGAATRTVDIHIRRLRQKLGPPWDKQIETVRHIGYKLRG